MFRLRATIHKAASVLALVILSACQPIYRNHGYVPRDDELAKVVVGKTTSEEVGLKVGRPSSIGVLTGSAWYYVGSKFKQYGSYTPVEVERQVVAISFDDQGVVSNIERFGLEKGEVIVISRRVTSDNIKGVSFINQLLGNIGKISAADTFAKN